MGTTHLTLSNNTSKSLVEAIHATDELRSFIVQGRLIIDNNLLDCTTAIVVAIRIIDCEIERWREILLRSTAQWHLKYSLT
ncbi:hypothetical protein EES38_03715 [Vibrio viridaestus]|uniref:Uncharacterized protein n=2 Tax=Vibrio viridaestus TaxID=2487322 RepID=A0A3N9TM37_9VIBR|nr:hypothetical protein EES38_03715 [Vibrio viridaestus]